MACAPTRMRWVNPPSDGAARCRQGGAAAVPQEEKGAPPTTGLGTHAQKAE
jgi:hypothetical protein